MGIDNYLKVIKEGVFGRDVRQAIHDGIYSTHQVVDENKDLVDRVTLRQDAVEQYNNQMITEMTDKDVISAPEIIAARGGKTTLGQRLDETTTQLAQTANDNVVQEQERILKGLLINNNELNSNRETVYYQSEIQNPIATTYTNVPIAMKVKFDKGECPSASHIVVKNKNGNKVPYQWEGEKHPNYLLADTTNLATYSDGSLNGGTIWVIGSLGANETTVYTIEVHSSEVSQSFTDNIPLHVNNSNPASVKDELTAGIVKFQFDSHTGNYHLRRYYQNNVEVGGSGGCTIVPFIANPSNVNVETQGDGATLWTSEKSVVGTGAVFKDYVVKNVLTATPSIKITTVYRVFANGYATIDCRLLSTAGTTNREVQGFGLKFKPIVNASDYSLLTDGIAQATSSSQGLLYKITRGHMTKDLINYNTVFSNKVAVSNRASSGNIFVNYHWDSTTDIKLNPNSMFYIKSTLIPINTSSVTTDEENKIMNLLTVHATKQNKQELTKRYFSLCKKFADHMHTYPFGNSFKGLVAYEKYANVKFNDVIRDTGLISAYDQAIKNAYLGASSEGFQMMWNANVGVQIIGRDTSPIAFMRKQAILLNATNLTDSLTRIIHALADFYVWLEDYSGGDGKIILYKPVGEDNLNSEATAMRALKNSLRIKSDATRQACYDRIKARFEGSMMYKTHLPYLKDMSVLKQPQFHYAGFSLFDYLDAVDFNPSFDIASYINQAITPSGKIYELGFDFAPERFGFGHTSMYAAYAMYHYGTISSLQTACSILENVISQCFPSGYHVYPLDNWKKQIDSIDQPIEVQGAYQAMMEVVFLNT